MVWISILLGVIEALPGIIKLIQEIIAAIHGHPLQAMHEHAFLGILTAWHSDKDPAKLQSDLTSLKARL